MPRLPVHTLHVQRIVGGSPRKYWLKFFKDACLVDQQVWAYDKARSVAKQAGAEIAHIQWTRILAEGVTFQIPTPAKWFWNYIQNEGVSGNGEIKKDEESDDSRRGQTAGENTMQSHAQG